jgi:nucleoside-diphosphate-sugar epimerase
MDGQQIVAADLEYICGRLEPEFGAMRGKKLLISGGAGFLGYYLIQAVLRWNRSRGDGSPIQLIVCDNYIRGVPEWLSKLRQDPALTLLTHDVTSPLPDEIDHFDFVIHAASIASPTYYRKHPIKTMDANVNGLRVLLDRFREHTSAESDSGFLFFSTSEIYGDPPADQIPTPETYRGNVSCTGPRACYDESKRYGETLCVNFASEFGLRVMMARPFNNYGPGLKITDRRVIPDFARDIFAGKDLVLLSDGSPSRTFCYVADAVVGYFKVLVRGRAGEPYNIGNESPETSMLELAQLLARIAYEECGYIGKVVRGLSNEKDYLTDNPRRRCPVIAKARSQLGFNPQIPLEEGLRRTIVWYKDNQQAQEA